MKNPHPEVIPVGKDNVRLYIDYANRYGRDHDESFIPGTDFLPDDDHPAWLLARPDREGLDGVIGALGLILEKPYRDEGRGRFTIIHTTEGGAAGYTLLRDTARQAAREAGIEEGRLYGFIPSDLKDTRTLMEGLGWFEERRAWLLRYDSRDIPDDTPPEGFTWETVTPADEAGLADWRRLINSNFSELAGHVELTASKAKELAGLETNITGGLEMLVGPDGPAGTIQAERDDDEPDEAFLGAISVVPQFRGRGFGRLLLRRGLVLALRAGLHPTWLAVNAENDNAVRLYLSEGFIEDKVMVCLALEVN